MKVILKQSIKNLGNKGELVEVKSGYGRNYLIPQGRAVLATRGATKDMELKKKRLQKARQEFTDQASKLAKELDGKRIEIAAKAGEKGKLFGSVKAKDIAQALAKICTVKIPEDTIQLDSELREVGQHKVPLHFTPESKTEITIDIIPEENSAK